jgi:predicted transcriptional regulator YdeE
MNAIQIDGFKLIGLALPGKTTNEGGQSSIDCGNLWQKFEKGKYYEKIPGKLNDDVLAVYHQYEGDHTKPFSYFIGCKVNDETTIPDGMVSLMIPGGTYNKIIAIGKMPDCIINTWKDIWESDIERAYGVDFEVYGKESKDWSNAKVEIFISISEQ